MENYKNENFRRVGKRILVGIVSTIAMVLMIFVRGMLLGEFDDYERLNKDDKIDISQVMYEKYRVVNIDENVKDIYTAQGRIVPEYVLLQEYAETYLDDSDLAVSQYSDSTEIIIQPIIEDRYDKLLFVENFNLMLKEYFVNSFMVERDCELTIKFMGYESIDTLVLYVNKNNYIDECEKVSEAFGVFGLENSR